MKTRTAASTPRSAGITLTEILISILILGVGLVSLATLFPIGLLRLREAQRQTRSAYLFQSATADVEARGLLSSNSFIAADLLNLPERVQSVVLLWSRECRIRPTDSGHARIRGTTRSRSTPTLRPPTFPSVPPRSLRAVTACRSRMIRSGGIRPAIYLDPIGQTTPEARFAAGSFVTTTTSASLLRPDPSDNGLASAHGLQRLTNFNRPAVTPVDRPMMPSAAGIPARSSLPRTWSGKSPQTPITRWPSWGRRGYAQHGGSRPEHQCRYTEPPDFTTNDWRFSWMITAQQNNSANGAAFEGNIVVFENRPFSIDNGVVAGETVVEAVFGASSNVSRPRAGRATAPAPTGPCCCAAYRNPSPTPSSRSAISSPTSPTSAARPGPQPVLQAPTTCPWSACQPAEQWRMGQPAGAALLLVPGAEGDPGPARPVHPAPPSGP